MPKKTPCPIPEDIDALLASSDYKVRAEAVRALGDTRNPDAIPYLIGMIGDKTTTVRAKVAQQLKKFVTADPDPQVLHALVVLSGDGHGVHRWVFDYLIGMGPRLVPTLKETIKHPEGMVRRATLILLWEMKDYDTLLEVLPLVASDHYPHVKSFVQTIPEMLLGQSSAPLKAQIARDILSEARRKS